MTIKDTKLTTINQFIELYAGPEYKLSSQYSSVLVMIFITFMYGLLLPILFPICLFGLFNTLVMDKLLLTYYYRKPPAYDDSMHKESLNLLKLAPIFMFTIGYWALGNPAVFKGQTGEMIYINQPYNPKHELIDTTYVSQAQLALVFLAFWVTKSLYQLITISKENKL